ncbi:hypothetical protein ACOSQ3_003339 [Xanthoceras sorbifolium]
MIHNVEYGDPSSEMVDRVEVNKPEVEVEKEYEPYSESNDSSDVSLVDEIENEENMVLDSADFCDLDGYDMDLQLSSDE